MPRRTRTRHPTGHGGHDTGTTGARRTATEALDAAAYQQLVHGDGLNINRTSEGAVGSMPAAVGNLCARCHAADGTGRGGGTIPSIAGQRSAYMYASLRAFRERHRFSAIMGEV